MSADAQFIVFFAGPTTAWSDFGARLEGSDVVCPASRTRMTPQKATFVIAPANALVAVDASDIGNT